MKKVTLRTALVAGFMTFNALTPVMAIEASPADICAIFDRLERGRSDFRSALGMAKGQIAHRDPLVKDVILILKDRFFRDASQQIHADAGGILQGETAHISALLVMELLAGYYLKTERQNHAFIVELVNSIAIVFQITETLETPVINPLLASPPAIAAGDDTAQVRSDLSLLAQARARQSAPKIKPAPAIQSAPQPLQSVDLKTLAKETRLAGRIANTARGSTSPAIPPSILADLALITGLRGTAAIPAIDGLYRTMISETGESLLSDTQWDIVIAAHYAALAGLTLKHARELMDMSPQNAALNMVAVTAQAGLFHTQVNTLKGNATDIGMVPTWAQDFAPHAFQALQLNQAATALFAPNILAQANAAAFLADVLAPAVPKAYQQHVKTASYTTRFLASVGSLFAKSMAFKQYPGHFNLPMKAAFLLNLGFDAISASWNGVAALMSFKKPAPELTDAEFEQVGIDLEKQIESAKRSLKSAEKELKSFFHEQLIAFYDELAAYTLKKIEREQAKITRMSDAELNQKLEALVLMTNDYERKYEAIKDRNTPESAAILAQWEAAYATYQSLDAQLKSRTTKENQPTE
jgi:hypothetical protein